MLITGILTVVLLLFSKADQQLALNTDNCTHRTINNRGVSGSRNDGLLCFTGGRNCTDLLSNVANNSFINITTDIVLSSKLVLKSRENITIIGHGHVTIYFQSDGAIKFVSCKNLTIKSIFWQSCGSRNETSGQKIEFYRSNSYKKQTL